MALPSVKVLEEDIVVDSDRDEVVLVSSPRAKLLLSGSLDHCVVCGHKSRREVTQEDISVGS